MGIPLDYSFLNEEYDNLYRNEVKSQKLFVVFAILSILIAGLGLFGLASYMAIRRTREVGLRKVNGATRLGIILLLSENFAKWVIIAFVIACPVCWFIIESLVKELCLPYGSKLVDILSSRHPCINDSFTYSELAKLACRYEESG